MYHIEKNGEGFLVSEDAGHKGRIVLRYFVERPDALRFLEAQRDAASAMVGRKMHELELARQAFLMIDKSLEAEAM